jgi:uncharacterized cupin superfamily protein
MTFHIDAPLEYDFGGSRARLLASGAQTGNAYCMFDIYSPAGRATPMHQHQHEDETVTIIEGELEVIVDDRRIRLPEGSSVTLPRGSRHQLINPTANTCRYMVVCSPSGFERFVDACSDAQTPKVEPGVPDERVKARMRAAAESFGITIYPPAVKG